MGEKLGILEVIAMGVGGMVSGGIFAVLGVAMENSGNAVPISYILAGILTLITAYSYIKLTLHFEEEGGAFSFIEHTIKNKHIAGYFGWILLSGYIGVMAMYAYAFGAYTVSFFEIPPSSIYRKILSIGIIIFLAGLNIIGVKESGIFEDILVYIKALFLFSIAILGIYFFNGDIPTINQFFNRGFLSPITGFAIIFVSYEGFQLLCYDYKDIKNVDRNLPIGMYTSIIIAILIYVFVSFMATLHLTPQMVIQYREEALARAVVPFLGSTGAVLVIITAIQSTASGINATLFGTSRLAYRIAVEGELPSLFSFRNKQNIPIWSLITISSFTAIFTTIGDLTQIVEFGSVAFIIADGATNYANLKLHTQTKSLMIIPLVGLLGTMIAFPIVIYHLYQTNINTLITIIIIFIILFILDLIHIKRKQTN